MSHLTSHHPLSLRARRSFAFLLTVLVGLCASFPLSAETSTDDDAPEYADPIYLSGPERLRMEGRLESLTVDDFNNDGRPDFAAFNPASSLLIVHYSGDHSDRRSNEFRLEDDGDWSWRERKLVLSQRATSMATGDFDGDGLTDLAFGAQSDGAFLLLQGEDGLADSPEELPAGGRQIVAGDFNQDGRDDLVMGSSKGLVVMLQGDKGLEIAHRLDSSVEPTGTLLLHDLDSDGIADIAFADPSDRTNILIRFGLANGAFGPEHRHAIGDHFRLFPLSEGRLAWLDPNSRAITVAHLSRPEQGTGGGRLDFGDPENLPLPGEFSGSRVSLALAPGLDGGDGVEAFISMDKAAEILRLKRDASGHLGFDRIPSFAGVTRLMAAADSNGGAATLFQLSTEEKVLAVSSLASLEDARAFPDPIEAGGAVVEVATGPFDADHPNAIWTIGLLDGDEDNELEVRVWSRDGDGLSELASFVLDDSFDYEARRLVAADLNGDGAGDLLVFFEFEDTRLYLGGDDSDSGFAQFDPDSGLGRGLLTDLAPINIAIGDPDADGDTEFVVARENFVRIYHLSADGEVTIEQQFNPSNRARGLSAPVLVNLDDDAELEIIVSQLKADRLIAFDLGAPDRQLEMRATKLEPLEMSHGDITGDGREDLIVLADKRVAILPGGGGRREVEVLSRTLTDQEDGLFGKIMTTNLLGDDAPPVLMAVEGREHSLVFYEVTDEGDLNSRYGFKVFNSPNAMDDRRLRRMEAEPREMLVADVDGDGMLDVVALAHENLLIYRQSDSAPDAE